MAGFPDHPSAYAILLPRRADFWLTIFICIGSRYVFDLYYDKEAISKQLYEWLLKNGYADGNLIAKWKKQGYEKVIPCIPKSVCRCMGKV